MGKKREKGPSLQCLKFPHGKTLSKKHFKNFENLSLKKSVVFIRNFAKVILKLEKSNFQK